VGAGKDRRRIESVPELDLAEEGGGVQDAAGGKERGARGEDKDFSYLGWLTRMVASQSEGEVHRTNPQGKGGGTRDSKRV
jgi:hypothetical protein